MSGRQTRAAAEEAAPVVKTFLDKWIEPALRPPAPSFTDYAHLNIARHGVLENMAPLGSLPTGKMKLKGVSNPRRSMVTLKMPGSAMATPVPATREEEESQPMAEPALELVQNGGESRKASSEVEEPQTPPAQTSRPASAAPSTPSAESQPAQAMTQAEQDRDIEEQRELEEEERSHRVDRIIESACNEALNAGRIPTAYALRTIYNDHRSRPQIFNLLEAVATGKATEAELDSFRDFMIYKKTEGSREIFEGTPLDKAPRKKRGVAYFEKFENVYHPTGLVRTVDQFASASTKKVSDTSNAMLPHKEAGHVSKKHKISLSQHSITLNLSGAKSKNLISDSNSTFRGVSPSSSSELSSVDAELLRSTMSPSAEGSLEGPTDANTAETPAADSNQPMTQDKAPGSKLRSRSSSNTFNPSSLPEHTANSKSPSRSEDPIASSDQPQARSHSRKNGKGKRKRSHKAGGVSLAKLVEDEEAQDLTVHRERAKDITDHGFDDDAVAKPSNLRHKLAVAAAESQLDADSSAEVAVPAPRQILRFRPATRAKAEVVEDLSSPTRLSFAPDVATESVINSRAGTPNVSTRPSRKGKSAGLRMKTSPVKKGAGTSAGIPRASGERSPTSGSAPHNPDDNDDYCSSCGGNGDLVCCDGCTRSFHFKCVDPPMKKGQLPDEWFCNVCVSTRHPPNRTQAGSFARLILNVETKNPSAFNLPKDVRDYFEDVRTGPEGEYEEGPVVSKAKNRAGYDEVPDYLKLVDSKGNLVLCHKCKEGSQGNDDEKRPIISCSFCTLQWHLDCLDPPLANPPLPSRRWRCPCHVNDLLDKVPSTLGPAHRFRRIKGASAIQPVLSRGTRNNGNIEVVLDQSDEEDEASFFEQKELGKVYKLPEKGIKLDFISRAHRERMLYASRVRKSVPMSRRDIAEQQAALNLTLFSSPSASAALGDNSQMLIDALMNEAPQDVIELMAYGNAPTLAKEDAALSEQDLKSLYAMKALIDRRLRVAKRPSTQPAYSPISPLTDKDVPEEDVEMTL